MWLSAPISITVEGANILSRNLMIFGQGAIRCHPFVLREMELVHEPDRDAAVNKFDDLLMQHIGFAVSNTASTLLLGLSFGLMGRVPGTAVTQPYFRALNRIAAAFAMLADLSMMLLGGELKRRERLSARTGDVLSHLYLASAALKQFHDLGHPAEQKPLLRWALEDCTEKAESALQEVLANFPNRILGHLLRSVPLRCTAQGAVRRAGCRSRRSARPPRGRSGAGAHPRRHVSPAGPRAASGRAEACLRRPAASQGCGEEAGEGDERRHAATVAGRTSDRCSADRRRADPAEAEQLRMAELARRKVIDVDDFAKEELTLDEGRIR